MVDIVIATVIGSLVGGCGVWIAMSHLHDLQLRAIDRRLSAIAHRIAKKTESNYCNERVHTCELSATQHNDFVKVFSGIHNNNTIKEKK